ncbi:MAG: glycosyltransferase family 4 protein [Chthoniobacterales bacterium]
MKFLFFSGHAHLALDPYSEASSGGAELQVALLSRELVKRGHQVTLLAAETGQCDGVVWEGIKVRTGGGFDTGKIFDTVLALPKIIKVISEEKPDAIIVYGWTSLLYFLAKLRSLIKYRLIFVCALDSEIDGRFFCTNPLRGYFFKKGMHACDVRFGITEHQAKLFRQQEMKCDVMRLLLQDPMISKVKPLEKKEIDLLWVARCNVVKQPLLFLDLAERLPEARCQMICSAQDKKLWQRVKDKAALLSNVEFLETVPYRHIQHHFDRAKVFVNTSLDEGVPNTFIHSGLGEAAIASLRVDPDKMFEQFQAGICAQNDFEQLVTGMRSLLQDEPSLTFAQQEAARFVKTWHNNEKNVDVFLEGIEL